MFQRHDDAVFLCRRNAREDRCLFRYVAQSGVSHFFQLAAQNDLSRVQSHLFTDPAAYQIAVTSNDLYFHSISPERCNGFGGVYPWGIAESQVTGQCKAALVSN